MLRPLPLLSLAFGGWLCVALLLLAGHGLAPRTRAVLPGQWPLQLAQGPVPTTTTEALPLELDPDLATLAPAAGDEGEVTGNDEHAQNTQSSVGAGKGKASQPDIPLVKIGGLTVTTLATQNRSVNSAILAPALRDDNSQGLLNRRFKFTPYAHNPTRGPNDAPVTIVEFNDLSCGQCRKDVKLANTVYTSHTDTVRQVSAHLPLSRYSDTNLVAFYGKVAQRGGKYWEFRQKILDQDDGQAGDKGTAGAPAAGDNQVAQAFTLLTAIGIDQAQARDWLTREARRYYRELDADAALGKALGLNNPPHFFLNGVHVGESGLPRDKVVNVAEWLLARRAWHLDETSGNGETTALPKPATSAAQTPPATTPAPVAPAVAGGHP